MYLYSDRPLCRCFEVYPDPVMQEVTHFCLPGLLPILKNTVQFVSEVGQCCFVFELCKITQIIQCHVKHLNFALPSNYMYMYNTTSLIPRPSLYNIESLEGLGTMLCCDHIRWLPCFFSPLPAGLLMLMGWRICGALVQFGCMLSA